MHLARRAPLLLLLLPALFGTLAAAAGAAGTNATKPSTSKRTYLVGGVDSEGPGSFRRHWVNTFDHYLNAVVGPAFEPPIAFDMVTYDVNEIAHVVADGMVDFAYLGPALATCAVRESSGLANTILTIHEKIHGHDLAENGGTVFGRTDNAAIRTLADLKDKRIIARRPDELFGYLAQVHEFEMEGMHLLDHVAQVIFTDSTDAIFEEVLAGRADAGFVEAGEIEERTQHGLLGTNALTVLHLEKHQLNGGEVFPFDVSTHLYPGGALTAHVNVDYRVQRQVAEALLSLNRFSPTTVLDGYDGWQPAANYLEIIDVLETAGILPVESHTCVDTSDIMNIVTCPDQYVPKSSNEILHTCTRSGLSCPASTANATFTCLCHPCKRACGENMEQEADGSCVCLGGYVSAGDSCVALGSLLAGIVTPVALLLAVLGYLVFKWQLKRADQLWHIKPHELKFDDPAICLGAGSFGVVVQAEYRGSKVALKSVISGRRGTHQTNKSRATDAHLSRTDARMKLQKLTQNSTAARLTRGTLFGFVYSGYERVENQAHRGLLQLKRALRQAAQSSLKEEEDRLAERVKEGLASAAEMDRVAAIRSADRTSGRGSRAARSQRVGPRRTISTFWKSAERRQRDEFVLEMRLLSKLRHPCVTTVIGAVLESNCPPVLVMEHMDLGSLHGIINNKTMALEEETMHMMMLDIVHGCRFLHAASPPVVHGDLKTMNVLVDSRFRAKVADFGLSCKYKVCAGTPFWMAPELLKGSPNSMASDVYAFGVVLYEMVTRKEPYEGEDAQQVLLDVIKTKRRPALPRDVPSELATIMRECWHWDAERRPTFLELERRMSHFDSMQVAQRNMKQNKSNNKIVDQVFPAHVAKALAAGEKLEPEHYDSVTIFFSDIVGFTDISRTLPPEKVCDMLDRLYTRFDILSDKHDIFKVETIGDAYMAVANLHTPQNNHAERIAKFGTDAIRAAQSTLIDESDPQRGCINLRVGFHTGSVVANVVGTKNPRYCLFGDTVNTASRMESSSEANKIHFSRAAYEELQRENSLLPVVSRGFIDVKGKGKMETFWLPLTGGTGRLSHVMSEDEMLEEVNRRRSGRLSQLTPAGQQRLNASAAAQNPPGPGRSSLSRPNSFKKSKVLFLDELSEAGPAEDMPLEEQHHLNPPPTASASPLSAAKDTVLMSLSPERSSQPAEGSFVKANVTESMMRTAMVELDVQRTNETALV